MFSGFSDNVYFQRKAIEPAISEDGWHALLWMREHLDPQSSFVDTIYDTAGAYLPAVAAIRPTGWHLHFEQSSSNVRHDRKLTSHALYIERNAIPHEHGRHRYDQFATRLLEKIQRRGAREIYRSGSAKVYAYPSKKTDGSVQR